MYLILISSEDPLHQRKPNSCYQSYFTDDIEKVSKCLKDGAAVYKLDTLTKVKDIEVTYQEITEETPHE